MANTKQKEINVETGETLEAPAGAGPIEDNPIEAGQVVATKTANTPAMQTQPNQLTPAGMVMWAIEHDKGLELIDQLMDRQDRYDKKMAEQAFNKAMADFKRNPPTVIKDKKNTQYNGSGYVSRGHLVNTVNQRLSEYGLSATWDIDQSNPEAIKITCILKHELGHSTQVSMQAPPDDSGKKNPIQQIKSTKTYLEVATYESVTGVVATDDGDDDGNASGGQGVPLVTEEQLLEIEAKISDNYDPKGAEKFITWAKAQRGIEKLSDLRISEYSWIMNAVDEAVSRREQANK